MVFPNINAYTFKSIRVYDRKYGLQSIVAKNIIHRNSYTEYIKLIEKNDKILSELEDELKYNRKLQIEHEAKTRALLEYMFSHRRLYRIYKNVLLRIDKHRYEEMIEKTTKQKIVKNINKKNVSFGDIEIREFTD